MRKIKAWWMILAILIIAPVVVTQLFFRTAVSSPSSGVTVFSSYSGVTIGFGLAMIWFGAVPFCLYLRVWFQRQRRRGKRETIGMAIGLVLVCVGILLFAITARESITVDESVRSITIKTGSLLRSEQAAISFDQIDRVELIWHWYYATHPTGGGFRYKECDVEIVSYGDTRLEVVVDRDYEDSRTIAATIAEASGKPLVTYGKD